MSKISYELKNWQPLFPDAQIPECDPVHIMHTEHVNQLQVQMDTLRSQLTSQQEWLYVIIRTLRELDEAQVKQAWESGCDHVWALVCERIQHEGSLINLDQLCSWWQQLDHVKVAQAQAQAQAQLQQREAALAKLTPEERSLLGV